MPLSDLEAVIDSCRSHLLQTNTANTEIESYITKFLLVQLCGEYEHEIKRIVSERVQRTNDQEIITFVINSVRIQSIKVSDLKGNILERFHQDCANLFSEKISSIDESVRRYDNIIQNRNRAAHGENIDMTFNEIPNSHAHALIILQAFSDSLHRR